MKQKLLLLLLGLVLCLTACTSLIEDNSKEIKGYCETFITAALDGDVDGALSAMSDGASRKDLEPAIEQIRAYLEGVTEFELKATGYESGSNNGTGYKEASFEMTTNIQSFYVTGTMVEGYNKLYNINIVSASDKGLVYTGTIDTLSQCNGTQLAILGLAAATLIFQILTLIHCCRRKVKQKALWILLILLGSLNIRTGANSFHIGLLELVYSHLKLFPNGSTVLQLVLPLGAILYYPLHRKQPDPTYQAAPYPMYSPQGYPYPMYQAPVNPDPNDPDAVPPYPMYQAPTSPVPQWDATYPHDPQAAAPTEPTHTEDQAPQ